MKQFSRFKIGILIAFVLIASNLVAQGIKYQGLVVDEKTKEPLAFVNIISSSGRYGSTSDIDGKFAIVLPPGNDSLRFSYLGYETKFVATNQLKGPKTIFLTPKQFELAEFVVVPGPNLAHRIIKNVVNNRDQNNPQKLDSYSYTTYDKMVITIDSIPNESDSLLGENDSTDRLLQFFRKRDLFLMETAVEKKFLAPDKSHERVVATKVSGLKDPMMVYLVSQLQSTSFYDEIIHIANKNYINPISKGSLIKYYFNMEDTLLADNQDTVFTISFRPRPNTNFDGMKGLLHISTNRWAIVNVKAEPAKDEKGIAVQIQQKYELINGEQWFPVQLNTNIFFDVLSVSSGGKNARLIGIGKTYIKDIELNPELIKRAFSHIEVELDPNAAFQKEEQWKSYRTDSLSYRDRATYQFMDSVGKEAKFDQKLKELETVLTGKVSWGVLDLLLDRFVGYNSFEGFWIGAGMETNRRVSEKFKLSAYYAYSFKDKQSKFGTNLELLLYKPKEIKGHINYFADNIETGSVSFLEDKTSLLDPRAYREYFISRMNFTTASQAGISWRMFNYFKVFAGAKQEKVEAIGNYQFQRPDDSNPFTDFKTTEFGLSFRFAYKEKFFDNGRMQVSMGTKYPILWVNYTQGFRGLLDSDFDHQKIDIQLRKFFYTKYLGQTTIDLRSGFILGDLPLAKLYSGSGTYGLFSLWAPASFGTMRPNEFLSDRYVSVFFSHNFGTLLGKSEHFKPEFELLTNGGMGWLNHPEYHFNTSFKTMELGYFESGLMINNLVRLYLFNVGIGSMYRYGAYSFDQFSDNISVKLTLTMPLDLKIGE
ncbi:MAG: carboxypeptidase-like regulatory domain-containing protein [Bacteroidales bacterium]|nr:carboxypeptidase-like regulatory domain-containing protein [Bacteroidales bacterium]